MSSAALMSAGKDERRGHAYSFVLNEYLAMKAV